MTTTSSAGTPSGRSLDEPGPALPRGARTAFAANAAIAWLGVVLTVVISALGAYTEQPPLPGLYGIHPDGLAGVVSRVGDTLSYFTIWSNVVVAVTMTLLARQSLHSTRLRSTPLLRTLRLDSVLMITITAIVYAVLLAPSAVIEGWSRLTDPILHQVTPAVTVLVWLVYGPRGWITRRTMATAMILPIIWVVWILLRASVIGAYPYDFVNISEYGVGPVAATLAGILVFGLVVTSVFWGIDTALRRWLTQPSPAAEIS